MITRLVSLTPGLAERWDAYVAHHRAGWFWHTTPWLAYQRAYRPGNEDRSFAVLDAESRAVVGIAPLILTSVAGRRELSYSGDPGAFWVADTREVAALITEEMRRRATVAGADTARFAEHPFAKPSGPRWLMAESRDAAHRVVDLTRPVPVLWADVRKSYRALIHRGERAYTISADPDGFGRYQTLHAKLATMPRPDATYRIQAERLADGQALVVVAGDAAVTWGAAYWYMYKRAAYYASGAYAARDVAHSVVWRSLLALREAGVEQASLGWQGIAQTDKEHGIEQFKRGFGGTDVPVRIAEAPVPR